MKPWDVWFVHDILPWLISCVFLYWGGYNIGRMKGREEQAHEDGWRSVGEPTQRE